jgi:hypothetical protein
MTLAIEPMVNAGSHEVYMKPDGWTICTVDGRLSAYFEHTVAITDKGPLILTAGRELTNGLGSSSQGELPAAKRRAEGASNGHAQAGK